MEYQAKHRHADMSARKIRPFAALIRGKTADEALEMLRFLPNRSARLLEAVLKSALGNAEDRGRRDIEDLVVSESRVDGGPMHEAHHAAGPRHGLPDQAALRPHPRGAVGRRGAES